MAAAETTVLISVCHRSPSSSSETKFFLPKLVNQRLGRTKIHCLFSRCFALHFLFFNPVWYSNMVLQGENLWNMNWSFFPMSTERKRGIILWKVKGILNQPAQCWIITDFLLSQINKALFYFILFMGYITEFSGTPYFFNVYWSFLFLFF